MSKKLHISYSSIATFLDCHRKYYWSYVKKLEALELKPEYLIGNAVHSGLHAIYTKHSNPVKYALKTYNEEREKYRKKLALSAKDEQHLNEREYMIKGILDGYMKKYSNHIKNTIHIKNEFLMKYPLYKDVIIVIKPDNILKIKNKLYVHEIKTSKYLTSDYVKGIKNNFQTNVYFSIHNAICDKKSDRLTGICFDVIKKPSIRIKMKESPTKFSHRLQKYYDNPNQNELFYMEMLDKPFLDSERVLETLKNIAQDIKQRETINDFYPNERFCYVYNRCEYYDICHYGESKETLVKFKIKGEKKND